MIELDALVDDSDDHGGIATRPQPRAFDAQPVESSPETALRGRIRGHKPMVMIDPCRNEGPPEYL
jgi:hypothetical protein